MSAQLESVTLVEASICEHFSLGIYGFYVNKYVFIQKCPISALCKDIMYNYIYIT